MCKVSQYTSTYSLHILDMCKDKYVLKSKDCLLSQQW
jgi:hypothetical protein